MYDEYQICTRAGDQIVLLKYQISGLGVSHDREARGSVAKKNSRERERVRVKTTTAFIHFNNITFCTTRTSITALKMVSVYIHTHTRQSILWRRRRRELGGQSAKLIQFGLHRFAIQRRRDRSNNTRERRRDRSNEYV